MGEFATRFSLFTNMTSKRYEVIIEGTSDGIVWKEYEFKYKPGDIDRFKFVPPFCMPRLDWRMWFLPTRDAPDWYGTLLQRLLEGSDDVLNLFERPSPFEKEAPRSVRGRQYSYRFNESQRWQRELPCLKDGSESESYFGSQMDREA